MADKYPTHGDRAETPVTVIGPIDVDVLSTVLAPNAATETTLASVDSSSSSTATSTSATATSTAATATSTSATAASAASMDAKLTTVNSNLSAIENNTDGLETGLADLLTELQLKADLTETQPVSGTVTSNQGTSPWVISGTVTVDTSLLATAANQTNRNQKTQLTNGTIDGSIKAASTAALAADTSLVVGLSPNSPLPTGSNVLGALSANQSVNQTQVNGVAVSVGAGTTGTGVQRVVLPTDQSAIPITASAASFSALDYGAVTTNPPTYTTGTNQPLSITTAGELRVHENGVSSEVDLNRFYSTGVSVNQPSSGTDNPLLLIRNPAASGKVIRLWKVNAGVGVTNVFSVFRTWANPTVTANGTAATAVSRNIGGGAPAAVGLVNTTPTVTSNGSQISSLVTGQNNNSVIFADDFSIAIRAGNSLLITGNPASNNRVSELTIVWTEE